MITTDLARSFRYDAWANRKILHALIQTPSLDERSRQIMVHLLMSQKVWLTRLQGKDTSALSIWPGPAALGECESLLEENDQGYQQFLTGLPAERLGEVVSYRTSTGSDFHTAVADILTQVLLHGSYHRGQLAIALKQQGTSPPATDYILFLRDS